jgi:hypothetical protein
MYMTPDGILLVGSGAVRQSVLGMRAIAPDLAVGDNRILRKGQTIYASRPGCSAVWPRA